jgi:hypothetical protein
VFGGRQRRTVLANALGARVLLHHRDHEKRFAPCNKREAKRRKAHANHCRAHQQALPPVDASARLRAIADKCTQTAHTICSEARPPSGATPRLSPGRTHPPLAQLQFPRFLRPDLTGVTRFDLSQVYRAPRGPVLMPVERWPRAAPARVASPHGGTALAPLPKVPSRRRPFGERDCNQGIRNSDVCQDTRDCWFKRESRVFLVASAAFPVSAPQVYRRLV